MYKLQYDKNVERALTRWRIATLSCVHTGSGFVRRRAAPHGTVSDANPPLIFIPHGTIMENNEKELELMVAHVFKSGYEVRSTWPLHGRSTTHMQQFNR